MVHTYGETFLQFLLHSFSENKLKAAFLPEDSGPLNWNSSRIYKLKTSEIRGFRRGMLNIFFYFLFEGWVDNLFPSFRDSLAVPSYLDYFTSEDEMDTLSLNVGKMYPLRLEKSRKNKEILKIS